MSLWLVARVLLVAGRFVARTEDSKLLDTFSTLLISRFEEQSRARLLDEPFEDIKSNVRVQSEYPKEALESAKSKLEQLFADRTKALQKLTRAAEGSARFYTTYDDSQFSIPQDESVCAKFEQLLNDSDVREASNSAARTSGVHVNIESYRCDPKVIRDFSWTGAESVEKTMAENKREDETMRHQFIGTYSGVTRMYPRRYWRVEPAPITIDLFDPKFRPWFVNAESAPKDIVFLIDYSGSVKGPTMHLIKITMMYILSTLSPNDYFFGVYFNSFFAPVLPCANGTFLPATTSNKKIFFERLGEIEEKDQAHVTPPLKFSLDALRGNLNSTDSIFNNYRSGGHKILMLFTDGLDEWPHAILDQEMKHKDGDVIRMFGFSMGYGTGQLPLLHWMACRTFARYSVIDSIMDVKPQSRAFLDHLSVALGRSLEGTPIEARRISWTNLYMEAQGLGPTITISLPIVTKPDGIWAGQRVAGIAGVDIALAELTERLPKGEQLYGIIVDNNGIIVHHPKLVLPTTEVHAVRRSACYDASQVRFRAGAGLRVKLNYRFIDVQYGFSDQRVYRLVGLIDSIPTIDLLELEGNSTAVNRLRNGIITSTCGDEPILDGEREFYCANLKGSPYSVVIVNSVKRETLVYTEKVTTLDTASNPFVTYYLSSRSICDWKLDPLPATSRFDALQGVACEEDRSLPYALTNALKKWAESWPQYDGTANFSCEDLPLPAEFPKQYFINAFVHTRSQIEAFFPSCAKSYMKEVITKFDEERADKENSTGLLQFSVRNDVIVAYRSITDRYDNRLAVVGVQWRMPYANALFLNWTRSSKQWSDCKKMDCLIITRSGFVLASSTNRIPGPLARFDPQLFASLEENNLVTITTWVDAQAECMASRAAPWASPAPGRVNPIQALVNTVATLLGKTFWIDLYYLMTSFVAGQPSMSGGICRFQRIKPVERRHISAEKEAYDRVMAMYPECEFDNPRLDYFVRCFLRHTNYKMTLNISKQIQLTDMKCARYARVYPVPGTTLTLIRADRACPGYRSKKKYHVQPEILEGCEKVTYFDKRPPTRYNTSVDPNEEPTAECLITDSTSATNPGMIQLLVILVLKFTT
ncbi:hypothetical protein Y032_0483g2295 [Ancylostoma ceylanicum]|uniref:VWFA domain-containing protein n=1 Tax=Ancylostoma ceylanicum TaxID=53326 RepID=A0A016WV66_9BILA|nr:hypothetical protein Y032_0483g2295 [Ancylostoma ceylanicum]